MGVYDVRGHLLGVLLTKGILRVGVYIRGPFFFLNRNPLKWVI